MTTRADPHSPLVAEPGSRAAVCDPPPDHPPDPPPTGKSNPSGHDPRTRTAAGVESVGRLDDLTQIIDAYNRVTSKLQDSHEKLRRQVLRLQTELASTNAQLERSKRLSALGEMAAGIAHEIRNPLAAIQLYAALIIDDLTRPLPGVQVAAGNADKIAQAVRGLNRIVTDVLSFAREIEPQPRQLTVGDLVDRAIEAHRPAINEAGVRIQPPGPKARALTVCVDPGLLHQALVNLIRNGVDAMAAVDGSRVLTLDAEAADRHVRLVVADSGPGIDQSAVDRIFNPFFTTRNSGTGLGLSIVHRIVDAHGGSISVRNANGARFDLHLPARRGRKNPGTPGTRKAKGPARQSRPATAGLTPGIRALSGTPS